jgi:hypothetical protein
MLIAAALDDRQSLLAKVKTLIAQLLDGAGP